MAEQLLRKLLPSLYDFDILLEFISSSSYLKHKIVLFKADATGKMSNPTQTIYTDATIIALNSSRDIILKGFILVDGSRIVAIGPKSNFPDSLPGGTNTISFKGRIVIPGLINTHAHLAQSILRGLAEDLPLHNWLCDSIWPLESCYEGDDGYVAARLTCAEMLKSGTTCFLEAMCTHRAGFERVVTAVGESGIRGCIVSFPRLSSDFQPRLMTTTESQPC